MNQFFQNQIGFFLWSLRMFWYFEKYDLRIKNDNDSSHRESSRDDFINFHQDQIGKKCQLWYLIIFWKLSDKMTTIRIPFVDEICINFDTSWKDQVLKFLILFIFLISTCNDSLYLNSSWFFFWWDIGWSLRSVIHHWAQNTRSFKLHHLLDQIYYAFLDCMHAYRSKMTW